MPAVARMGPLLADQWDRHARNCPEFWTFAGMRLPLGNGKEWSGTDSGECSVAWKLE